MTSARLLVVVFLLCPLVALSQEKQPSSSADSSSAAQSSVGSSSAATADSSSYRTMTAEQKAEFNVRALQRLIGDRHVDINTEHPWIKVTADGKIAAWGIDSTCYTIRSYVVERDDKDSDSTHLVRSSTCQPATHYQMKNADLHPDSDSK